MKKFVKIILIIYIVICLTICIIGNIILKEDVQDTSISIDDEEIMYGMSEFLGVTISNQSIINLNEEIIEKLEKIEIDFNKNALIYHTHAREAYKSSEYELSEDYRTADENYNVLNIGNHLKNKLTEEGYEVIHNKEDYEIPDLESAYIRSKEGVQKILSENKNIDLLIDIHRESFERKEIEKTCIEIEGERVARLRFVIGADTSDDEWLHDLKLALEIQKKANEKYPDLFRPIIIRERDYNQDLSKYSILLEVGEDQNSIEEANEAIDCFVELLTQVNK